MVVGVSQSGGIRTPRRTLLRARDKLTPIRACAALLAPLLRAESKLVSSRPRRSEDAHQ